jgi:subtilisin family serine protease
MKRCATARSRASVSVHVLERRIVMSAAADLTGLTDLRIDPAFAGIDGSDVGVAVLDTGIFGQHPQLRQNVVAYYNAVTSPLPAAIDSTSVQFSRDLEGHGTHVAGTVASVNPEIGVAPGAKIVSVHVLPDPTEPQIGGDSVLRGLQFVERFADQFNIKVVNMSLGQITANGGLNINVVPDPDALSDAIDRLEAMGITVVSSSGNSYANDPVPGAGFPAVVSTLSVANTWATTGVGHDFSAISGGSGLDNFFAFEGSALPDRFNATSQRSTLANQVAAPGTDIFSTWNGEPDANGGARLFNTISGTSMASPFVAGVVALMQDAALTYGGRYFSDPNDIADIIKETADVVVDSNVADNGRFAIVNGNLDPTPLPLPETGETFLRVNALNAVRRVRAIFLGGGGGDLDRTAATATTVPALTGGNSIIRRGRIGADGAIVIGPNDVDLFKLQIVSRGDVSISLTPPAGGQVFNPSVRLFDAAGNQLARADGANGLYPTFRTAMDQPLNPGTYYVGVSSLNNVTYTLTGAGVANGLSEGDYALVVSLNNPDFDGVVQGAHNIDLTTPETLAFASVISNQRNGVIGLDAPPPGQQGGTTLVTSGDVDMYRVVAPDSGRIEARTQSSRIPGGVVVDTYLRLFDSAFNEIAANDDIDFPANLDSLAAVDVTAGQTYYVAVTNFENRTFSPTDPYGRVPNSTVNQEPYSLFVAFTSGDVDGTAVTAVPRTIGQPVVEAIGTDGTTVVGSNNGAKDVDFHTFAAPADGLLDLSVAPVTGGFESVLALWQYNPEQHTIIKLGESAGLTPRLIRQVGAGNVLYASVTGRDNQAFNWFAIGSGPGGQVGGYTLTSALQPLPNLLHLSNGAIDTQTPTAITAGIPFAGNIGLDNSLLLDADVDLYRFQPTATGRYDVRTDTSAEGSADTLLRLFDAAGNPIALNDNATGSTNASALRVNLAANQVYYIGVSTGGSQGATYDARTGAGVGVNSRGPYALSVNPTAAGAPAVSISDAVPTQESFRGGAAAVFTVSLDVASAQPVTVAYVTSDGSATAGSDYAAGTGTVTFAPGETSKTIAVPVSGDRLVEGDETFNVDVTVVDGAQAAIADEHGTALITNQVVQPLGFNAALKAAFTDATGNRVVVSLRGPGSGEVLLLGGTGGDPAAITLTGTTGASALNIAGDTTVGDITVNGSLRGISGRAADLVGNLSVSGSLGQLRLRNVGAGRAITVGPGAALAATLGAVTDTSITSAEPIRSLRVARWLDGDATADAISAPSIGTITSLSDFGADVTAGSLLGLNVRGTLGGSNVLVNGLIRAVRLGAASASRVFAGVNGTALPDSRDDFLNPQAAIGSFTVRSGSFSNTLVAAPAVGRVLLGSVATGNNGTPFGVAADELRSLRTPTITVLNATEPSASRTEQDFVVRIV